MILKIIRNTVLFVWVLVCTSYANDVVLLTISNETLVAKRQLDLACQFWGVKVECLTVENGKNVLQFAYTLNRNGTRAIVITARALEHIDLQALLIALQDQEAESVPLLIMGVTPQIDSDLLSNWSGGAVIGCKRSKVVPFNGFYRVSDFKVLARQLSGQRIPCNAEKVNYLILDDSRNMQTVVEYRNKNEKARFPIFVRFTIDRQEMFFLTNIPCSASSKEAIWRFDSNRFVEIAPLMMFLRYACGEHCWHSVRNYANLTIDDPWLTEPYGHLSYKGLLKEMEKANFHTTIAFIPWNYDRSKPEIISLLSDNPDRFSICIHGNNHDHREFYKYEAKLNDPWLTKPLHVQEANIKQALARMEKFRYMTGLSYDKVMVFPHGIAPAKTLALLKKYNFMATVNEGNVPLGSPEPTDALFRLRAVTLKFENFPSINRFTPERTKSDIAKDLFLGKPLLFHEHHDFFQDGIDSFNETAEMINNIQSDIIWQSLGYIVQHLYLEKLMDDGNYNILAFSSNFILENDHQRNLTYFVRKDESFSFPIKQVTVDGQPYSYRKSGSYLMLEVYIPSKESCHIVIEYENELDLTSVDISKNNPRVNRLRKLSDIRDLIFSKNVFGRTFSYFYYNTGLYKLSLKRLTIILLILIIMFIFITFVIWHIIKRKKTIDHCK